MREIETDFIEKVINIMKDNELTEVTLEDDERSLYLRTSGFTPVINISEKSNTNIEEIVLTDDEKTIEEKSKLVPVISNMIGLFFSKPSPIENPFVQVGDRVKKGQQICIIETIKLMNKVVSEVSGTVKEICIEDGKPVEYGQVIMYIEQD